MKIDVGVDTRAISLQLNQLRNDILAPAAASALNRTATSVRAEAVRFIRRQLPLAAKSIRTRLTIERAAKTRLTARIVARRDYDPPLSVFGPKWKQRQPGGATVKLPGRARQGIPGAFVARTRYGRDAVFRRVGKARTPLKFLRASDVGLPTVSSAFLQAGADASVLRLARERFRANLARELAFRGGA
jgi:hypothetical protein